MSSKKKNKNHQVNPDEQLLGEYIKMQLMVYNYKLFIFNYSVKIKKPDLPDIYTIQKTSDDLKELTLGFRELVEGANLAVELEGYLIDKSDFMQNEIVAILGKLAKAKGCELEFR
jgi:hypothetical protein